MRSPSTTPQSSRCVLASIVPQTGEGASSLRFFSANATKEQSTQTKTPLPPPPSPGNSSNSNSGGSNYFIKFGWFLLGVVAIDQALQYKQEYEAKQHLEAIQQMQQEANLENSVDWDMSLPTKFECKVSQIEPSLDGVKMLRNIRVGDIVEVMEAGTGPNEAYHLCRVRSSKNNKKTIKVGDVGWYPIYCLEKV